MATEQQLRGELTALLSDQRDNSRMLEDIKRKTEVCVEHLSSLCKAIERALTINERVQEKREEIKQHKSQVIVSAIQTRQKTTLGKLRDERKRVCKEMGITGDQLDEMLAAYETAMQGD